ncbi:MAG: glycosyltransferase family 2 protein [Cryomorphaceae bacterium]|nr:glycosyltransferase family 2 protein [Cryomorphaceae bacterium]
MKSPHQLTVFTPTYNRAYCLPQLYHSLCAQTDKNFTWLVIDDGSTDETKKLIESWVQDGQIFIQYCYKENGGMHTGHNKAYELVETRFNVCIDSDDYMPMDAVEIILEQIIDIPDDCYGLVGLDGAPNGSLIGTAFPDDLEYAKLSDVYTVYGVKGDKKLVLKTELVKQFPPYPTFEYERFVPLGILYLMMDQQYKLKLINQVLCVVEYQEDGSTKNILKQYRRHPNGFAYSRVITINLSKNMKEQIKNAIHLVSSAIFAKNIKWLFKSRRTLLVLIVIPIGLLLNMFIRYKTIQ